MAATALPCPWCGVGFQVPRTLGGRIGRCRKCGRRFTIAADARSLARLAESSAVPSVPAAPAVPAPACTPSQSDFGSRQDVLAAAHVVPEPERCVQCGICSYNCPMEIDVRAHAWRGLPIHDSHCLTCSECVKRCPRGVLRFERLPLTTAK